MSDKLDSEHIDFLCAKKIMGYGLSAIGDGALGWSVPTGENRSEVIPQSQWRPSEKIADAWKVLEKFSAVGFVASVQRLKSGKWMCFIDNDSGLGFASGDSAPMCICLAALKVVGVDVESEV